MAAPLAFLEISSKITGLDMMLIDLKKSDGIELGFTLNWTRLCSIHWKHLREYQN